jgi:hypothetical protein
MFSVMTAMYLMNTLPHKEGKRNDPSIYMEGLNGPIGCVAEQSGSYVILTTRDIRRTFPEFGIRKER